MSTPTEEVETIIAEILKSLNEIKLPVDEIKKEENIPCDKPKVIFLSFFLSLSSVFLIIITFDIFFFIKQTQRRIIPASERVPCEKPQVNYIFTTK